MLSISLSIKNCSSEQTAKVSLSSDVAKTIIIAKCSEKNHSVTRKNQTLTISLICKISIAREAKNIYKRIFYSSDASDKTFSSLRLDVLIDVYLAMSVCIHLKDKV